MKIFKFIQKILIPNQRLSQRAISSGIWFGIAQIANRSLSLVRTVILARILAPKDFGLFGIALIMLSALQNFSQPGTGEAIIQSKKNKRIYLDVAWSIKVIRGIALALILVLLAPMIARFFREPKATYLMYIIGASLIFGGFGNQGVIYFIKDLEFHKQFIYEFSCTIVDFVVSLILVFMLRDAFALAYGYLAGILVLSIASYIVHPFRPRFIINIAIAKELTKFGKWVWGYTILGFMLNQGVGFFIGKGLGTVFLGLYQMAVKITSTITTDIGSIFSSIGFPLYSKLQDDKLKLNEAYSKSLKVNSFLVVPIAIFLFIFSKIITIVVLGSKWNDAIPLIRIFALYGLMKSFSSINNAVFKAIGYPSVTARIQIVKLLCLLAMIFWVSFRWQLIGIALLVTSLEILLLPIEFLIITKRLGFSRNSLLRIIAIPTVTSLVVLSIGSIFSQFIAAHINCISLLIMGIIIATAYAALLYLLDLKINFGLRKIFSKNYFLQLMGNKI